MGGMTDPDWARVRKLLEEALEHLADERAEFLESACVDAPELRREVESLLAREEQNDFLEEEPPPSAPANEVLGHFRIVREIGRGATSIVYEAEQQEPRRSVALKVVRSGLFVDASYLRMFEREVETLARLSHPNIAAIYESGATPEGEHFFAMELLKGATLSEFLSS